MASPIAYTVAAKAFVDKEWSWGTDAFSALLLDNTYTFDQDGHEFVADLTGEPSGGSYARVALSGKSTPAAAGVVKLLCADVVFAAMTASDIRYMVVFRNTGSDATAKLVCCVEFDTDENPSAQTVTGDLSGDGLLNLNVS